MIESLSCVSSHKIEIWQIFGVGRNYSVLILVMFLCMLRVMFELCRTARLAYIAQINTLLNGLIIAQQQKTVLIHFRTQNYVRIYDFKKEVIIFLESWFLYHRLASWILANAKLYHFLSTRPLRLSDFLAPCVLIQLGVWRFSVRLKFTYFTW